MTTTTTNEIAADPGVIGKPLPRLEGRLKVTGAARYSGDMPLAGLASAAIVHSTIANGRILAMRTQAAELAPGVITVFTYRNFPRMNPTPTPWSHLHPHGQGYLPMQDDIIHYAGQPIALVVAETLDQATYAGTLVEVDYESKPVRVFSEKTAAAASEPPQFLWPVNSSVGNASEAIANSPVKIQRTYTTADRHHMQMEPHASMATWDAQGRVTLFESTQHIYGCRELVSIVLGVPIKNINVVAHYVGGGFGGKAYVWPHTLLALVAAREVKRPVRLQITRAQTFSMVGHQPASIQTITLGAERDGKLNGIEHYSITPSSMFDKYIEYAANSTRSLWGASGGIATGHKILQVNRNTPTPMRSPHEALGHVAIECALDELAYETGVDPVAIRLLNDTQVDPASGRPFSTRAMRECLEQGAQRFGWTRRSPKPRSMRDGRYLVGQGIASAIYTHWRWPAKARVVLNADGTALVETGSHEIGGGTYTVMRQVAADTLGIPVEHIQVHIGDSQLPAANPSIGSATVANTGAAVLLAALAAREQAVKLAIGGKSAPFKGVDPNAIHVANGRLTAETKTGHVSYAQLLRANGLNQLQGDGDYDPLDEAKGPKAIFSFSAVYAEVRVDEDLGLARVSRVVGIYDAGRIINARTARSQAIGGIIWGIGQALLEQSEADPHTARYLNRNCSGYLIPSNADVPDLDVGFAGGFDSEASILGAKGLGELTAVSVAPAIMNAVYHATGKRIRELPITIEKLI